MKILLKLILFLAAFSICSAHAQKKTKAQKELDAKLEKIDADAKKALAQAELMVKGSQYMIAGQWDSAIIIYTKIIEQESDDKMKILYRGLRASAYSANGQSDFALTEFTELLRQDPSNTTTHFGKAYAYYAKWELDSSMQEFNECIRLDPNYAAAYNGKGQVYHAQGDYLSAIKEFETWFTRIPAAAKSSSYSYCIVPALIRVLNFEDAKKYYNEFKVSNRATYILPKDDFKFLKYYFEAAAESIPDGKYEEALTRLNNAAKEYNMSQKDKEKMYYKSAYTDILAAKGYTLEKLNKWSEAKTVYEQSLAINPRQPDIKDALAAVVKKINELVLSDKTPPVIEIISPQPTRSFDIESDNGATQITGRATDESGIASLTINGKKIDKVEEDGLFITNYTLKPGANSIAITATDKQGNVSNKTFIITGAAVVKKKEKGLDIPVLGDMAPKYYAILIAEKDYMDGNIPDLQNPVKDARELKAILESQYSFDAKNIDTLYNQGREDIMQVIVQRCNTLTDNDNLVIFYAGHGTAEKDKYGDVDGYWIPVSAKKGQTSSYISAEDINKSLKRSNAKHILVIADACFSGAFTRQLPGDASKTIQKQYKVNSRKIMASGNLEPVPDNSKFLYYLKKNLQENPEKYLSAKDLFDSFYKAIINNTENLPQYAAIKNVGDEGGEFVFIKK